MRKKLICMLAVVACAHHVSALIQESGLGIIYGTNYAFSLKAPEGWVLDTESGVTQGVQAVFYPVGSSWKDSTVVAYARSRPRTEEISSVEAVVYFAEEKTFNYVVLNSRNSADFEKFLESFEALAISYIYMGDKSIGS